MQEPKFNLKKLKFKSIGKKFCSEICCKDDCKNCKVKEYGSWMEDNKDALYLFQEDYKYVVGSRTHPFDIYMLFDWEKCKDCKSMVYMNERMHELEKDPEYGTVIPDIETESVEDGNE